MYIQGKGVPQDYTKAIELYTKAANQKHAEAQFNLGIMYFNGKGIPTDKDKAKEYFKQACLNRLQKGCDAYKELNN